MKLPLYQIDAFTDRLFGGNPAAVVPLDAWLADDVLLRIAEENNLSETAFLVPTGGESDFHLRWFTPAVEVELCGHATLATGHALFHHLGFEGDRVRFESKSGILAIEREGDRLVLDFPAAPRRAIEIEDALVAALGARPEELYAIPEGLMDGRMAVFASQADVAALAPDFAKLKEVDAGVALVTAPGDEHDFISRLFAPGVGIDEDPVTGAAHCASTPYWAERLGKNELSARQISARGGDVHCVHQGDRVRLGGHAVTYLVGEIEVG